MQWLNFLKLFTTFAHLPQGSYKKMQRLMVLHLLHDTTTKCHARASHPCVSCCIGVRISLWYKISQWYHVNTNWPHISVWNQSADRLEQAVHTQCLRFWIAYVFDQREVYLKISRYEMTTQSLRKRDMKWKSHPGVKLAPVRVFSCKNHLRLKYRGNLSTIDMIWQYNLHNQQLSNEMERQSICMGIAAQYSETCIKRTPSIKRTVAEVPKFISLIYFKWNLY